MKFTYTCKKVSLNDSVKAYAEKKVGKLEKFFKEEHTEKEKIAFLKNEYGTGGQGRSGFNEWHDAKGISYKKGSLSTPDCEAFLKWNEVAERIDRLIAEGRYVTQKDIDERIKDAKRTLKNKTPDDDYDRAMIEQAKKVLEEYGVSPDKEPKQSPLQKIIAKAEADEYFRDNQEFDMAGIHFKVLHTPGHTLGGCCYYDEADSCCFCGDTIFNGSVGRTDFYSGSARALIDSIQKRIFTLPPDTKLYPGHNEETTVAYEMKYNPCCR